MYWVHATSSEWNGALRWIKSGPAFEEYDLGNVVDAPKHGTLEWPWTLETEKLDSGLYIIIYYSIDFEKLV